MKSIFENSVTDDRSITSDIVTKGTSNYTHQALSVSEPPKVRGGLFRHVSGFFAFALAACFGLFGAAEGLLAQVEIPEEMAAAGLVESGLGQWADAIGAILVAVVAFALVGVVIRLLTGRKAVRG